MKKQKILESLLRFINSDAEHDTARKYSSEDEFIIEIVKANLERQRMEPPASILKNLKSHSAGQQVRRKPGFFSAFDYRYIAVLPAILIFIGIMLSVNREAPTDRIISLSDTPSGFKKMKEGTVLQKTGLQISSSASGELAFEVTSAGQHVLIKTGSWEINTDHARLEKETWFHFPGGGVKPIGTSFSINIQDGRARVHLIEGKIQTYSIDSAGRLEDSRIESAPFSQTFPEAKIPESVERREKIIHALNHLPKDSGKKPVVIPEISVYRNFIGADLTLESREGLKYRGILENAAGGKLFIRIGNHLEEVEEQNVTLLGLDFPADGLKKDSLFGD